MMMGDASRFQKNRAPLKRRSESASDPLQARFPVPKEPGPIEAALHYAVVGGYHVHEHFPVPKEPGPIEA